MAVAKITSRCPKIKIVSFHLFFQAKQKPAHHQKNPLQLTGIPQIQTKHWDAFFFLTKQIDLGKPSIKTLLE